MPTSAGSVTFAPFTYRSRCWWMWSTVPSRGSGLSPSSPRRPARPRTPLFHGGGPLCRPRSFAQGITRGAAADEPPATDANTTSRATPLRISLLRTAADGTRAAAYGKVSP